jgi:hypothetical protein
VVRSEQHRVAEPMRDELNAPQDERAHQDVAQLGIVLHDRHQVRAIELDHFAGF